MTPCVMHYIPNMKAWGMKLGEQVSGCPLIFHRCHTRAVHLVNGEPLEVPVLVDDVVATQIHFRAWDAANIWSRFLGR